MPANTVQFRLRRFLGLRVGRGRGCGLASTALLGALPGHAGPQQQRHPFDRKHGVDTSGLIYGEDLAWGHEHDHESAGYYATAPSLFHHAIERWSGLLTGSGYTLSDYTLVDIGAGKGRVVMMASEYAFREVVGVELNPNLAKIARKNLRAWTRSARACRDLRLVKGDALSFPLPDEPVVLFFFNSFEREMVRMWLERLVEVVATRTAPVDLIYVHPEHRELFLQTPTLELLAEEVMPFSEEDATADVFGVTFDQYAVYRLSR